MTPQQYLEIHPDACTAGSEYALQFATMAEVWDDCERPDWLLWMVDRVPVQESALRRISCRFVRETPIGDGRTVWDLLTDPRSRHAVEVAERHASGAATDAELREAWEAAYGAVARAAGAATATYAAASAASFACAVHDAAYSTAAYAADAAGPDYFAARATARAAQCRIIREEITNPFTVTQSTT